MSDGTFPSSQGDSLNVTVDEEHLNGLNNGEWTPPEYAETAKTWLQNPAAVPVPVRVDAGILLDSRMMHSSTATRSSARQPDDAETIDDEVFGTLRSLQIDDMEGMDPTGWYLDAKRGIRPPIARRRTAARLCGVDPRPARGAAYLQRA